MKDCGNSKCPVHRDGPKLAGIVISGDMEVVGYFLQSEDPPAVVQEGGQRHCDPCWASMRPKVHGGPTSKCMCPCIICTGQVSNTVLQAIDEAAGFTDGPLLDEDKTKRVYEAAVNFPLQSEAANEPPTDRLDEEKVRQYRSLQRVSEESKAANAQPTSKSGGIEDMIAFVMGKDRKATIRDLKCMTCSRDVYEFRDVQSRAEYHISGMCQVCQDGTFG